MKIALISDILTQDALSVENKLESKQITPLNYMFILKFWKPDLLFVESAWQGHNSQWRYKIASYDNYPKRNNSKLRRVVNYAKKLGIPTVFWNKEDGIHFDRFIESAKLFDHIFTVDENCISKYRKIVSKDTTVNILMFAVQSKFHNYNDKNFSINSANFVGSYSRHVHDKRREWQDMAFEALASVGISLDVYDRNSDRKSINYRYPSVNNLQVKQAVTYKETAKIYKNYKISLNVNTIIDSNTMFSRRLIEILACGGIAITNNTKAVEKYFKEYCYVADTKSEMIKIVSNLKNGLSVKDKVMAKKASEYILKNHTWTHRLQEIREVVGI